MPLYERFVDGVKVARAFTVDGSEDDVRHAALAASGENGWQAMHVGGDGDHGPDPSRTLKKRTTNTAKGA